MGGCREGVFDFSAAGFRGVEPPLRVVTGMRRDEGQEGKVGER
jgi:hypothetical protein